MAKEAPRGPRGTASRATVRQTPVKRNTSILNFFKKTDSQPQPTQPRITVKVGRPESFNKVTGCWENSDATRNNASESLFFDEGNGSLGNINQAQEGVGYPTEESTDLAGDCFWDNRNTCMEAEHVDAIRFNENMVAVKRQKRQSQETVYLDRVTRTGIEKPHRQSGPFLDISDSDSDMEVLRNFEVHSHKAVNEIKTSDFSNSGNPSTREGNAESRQLVRVATSDDGEGAAMSEPDNDIFEDDQWIEEEHEFAQAFSTAEPQETNDEGLAMCPICMASLLGLSDAVSSSASHFQWVLISVGSLCTCQQLFG